MTKLAIFFGKNILDALKMTRNVTISNTITSMMMVVPVFISLQCSLNMWIAIAIIFICLTSILNHGSDHEPVLQNLDYAVVNVLGIVFLIYGILRHSACDIAAIGVCALGSYLFYFNKYKLLNSITGDIHISHSAIHLIAIAGFTLLAVGDCC